MEIVIQKLINHHAHIQMIVGQTFVMMVNIIQSKLNAFFSNFYFLIILPLLIRRGNWREQRTGGGNNRRGGSNNYSMNNQKANQRSEQAQYTSSRSSEQSTNTRQQYKSRNNRFTENRSPHEGRDSPSQAANDETARSQRINSGSLSQGQNSGPTSPSTNVPGRTIYPTTNRPPIGRNSPAPYTGSSSSRNNSTTGTTTSPSPTTTTTGGAPYQTSSTGTGNYAQQSNNKMARKPSRSKDNIQYFDIENIVLHCI